MITSRIELKFYLKADEIMNEQVFPQGFIKRLLLPKWGGHCLVTFAFLFVVDVDK